VSGGTRGPGRRFWRGTALPGGTSCGQRRAGLAFRRSRCTPVRTRMPRRGVRARLVRAPRRAGPGGHAGSGGAAALVEGPAVGPQLRRPGGFPSGPSPGAGRITRAPEASPPAPCRGPGGRRMRGPPPGARGGSCRSGPPPPVPGRAGDPGRRKAAARLPRARTNSRRSRRPPATRPACASGGRRDRRGAAARPGSAPPVRSRRRERTGVGVRRRCGRDVPGGLA